MNSTRMDPADERRLEDQLSQLLVEEADRVSPSPDALRRIQARLTVRPARAGSTRLLEPPRLPRRAPRYAAAALSLGVAAALVFTVLQGAQSNSTPQPAQSPVAPTAPFTAAPNTTAPKTLAVYRVGSERGRLYREWVGVTEPFSRAQALQALLGSRPVDPDLSAAPTGAGFRVASMTETEDYILVDLSANDTSVRPTSNRAAVAEQWVQSWVYTVQDAFEDTLPVKITLHGKPTTLYGEVDTTRPIKRDTDLRVQSSYGIFSPRDGATVTSPVQLSALAPSGAAGWVVYDVVTHRRVFDDSLEDNTGTDTPGTFSATLPAGRYQGVYETERSASKPAFRRTVNFSVSGPAAPATSRAVTDPPTTALDLVAIYVPQANGTLAPEWVARPISAKQLVLTLLERLPHDPRARVAAPGVASVTESADGIFVDLSRGAGSASVPPSLVSQALAWTVDGYFDSTKDVHVTLNGRATGFGSVAAGEPVVKAPVKLQHAFDLVAPVSGAVLDGRLSVVAGVEPGTRSADWFVFADDTHELLFQGTVTGITDARPAVGFSLALPAGAYQLELDAAKGAGSGHSVLTDFTIR